MGDAVLSAVVFDELKAAGWAKTAEAPTFEVLCEATYRDLAAPKVYLTPHEKRGWWVVDDLALCRKATLNPEAFGVEFFPTPEEAIASRWKTARAKTKGGG